MVKRMKKIGLTGITILAVLGSSMTVCAAEATAGSSYMDVTENDWFYDAVMDLNSEGVVVTPGDGLFHPYENTARAQLAVILYRMEKEPEVTTTKSFPDVEKGMWYTDAILWAAENDILTGYENGYFGTADNITREQLAVMLYRYAKFKGYTGVDQADFSRFVDADALQPFSKEGMAWAVANGIIQGKDLDNDTKPETLQPQGSASRAETAVMLSRFEDVWAAITSK